ncbi:MAG: 16S rRNA (cytosine(1402)-N(4))-methyltransferase RsmH [Patescibacteria group bacterium]|jgi:16S rRNA (cytosine1402-N4)-methyltransferase
MKKYSHFPVMLSEAIDFLNIKEGELYFDGTLGGGSYSQKILEKIGKSGLLLSVDLDPWAIDNFALKKFKNIVVVNDNFSNLENIVLENKIISEFCKKKNYKKGEALFSGMVLDLGLSSAQLDDSDRGFSFHKPGPLDMSFGPNISETTYYIVNSYSQRDLEDIIKNYGEESWARKIAQAIVLERKKKKIEKSEQLAEIIAQAIPRKFWSRKIHPATKTFQALRIETNDELNNLKKFLPVAIKYLKPGGRLVIVSFHSLEDRIVKNFFKELGPKKEGIIKILTPKPLVPQAKEIEENFRSRSAKLRAIEKL